VSSAFRLAVTAIIISLGAAITPPVHAQSQTLATSANGTKFEYEVASIKLDKSDRTRFALTYTADGITGINVGLQMLIEHAYGVQDYQILGIPNGLSSDTYEINAKMDSATADALAKLSREESNLTVKHMLQTVLADRLKLVVHWETRQLPVYLLIVAKNGLKLKESKPGDDYANGSKGVDGSPLGAGFSMMYTTPFSNTFRAQAIAISGLAMNLAGPLGRPVLDKTGLTGKYDVTLEFAPLKMSEGAAPNGQPASTSTGTDVPFLFDAIQRQLGLKLESGKGPVEVIVIDHIERPSAN
jgi:uncharacterized protein (TIGR03435 family)